jgi:hypothetical protein
LFPAPASGLISTADREAKPELELEAEQVMATEEAVVIAA